MKKKPAPQSEQTITYSTSLAWPGRSPALAPTITVRLAAKQRRKVRFRAVVIKVSCCIPNCMDDGLLTEEITVCDDNIAHARASAHDVIARSRAITDFF